MKSYTSLIILIILSFSTIIYAQDFYIHENSITIVCDDAEIGESGIIDGVIYTKRSKDQVTTENASTSCTSGIEDMTDIFYYKRSFNEDISHWGVSSITKMGYMFSKTSFNQDGILAL